MTTINRLRSILLMNKCFGLKISLILCLSLTSALMHYAFVNITRETIINSFAMQKALLCHPLGEARLLSSLGVNIFYILSGLVIRHDFWVIMLTLILTESVFAFFALGSLYLVAQSIINDDRYSMAVLFFVSIFTPLAYQLASRRYGELLSFGFYMFLVYLVSKKREFSFLLVIIIASLQRPEMAISAVFYKLISNYHEDKSIYKTFYNLLMITIPFIILALINIFYKINTVGYVKTFLFTQIIASLKGVFLYWPVFAPLLLLTFFNFRYFGWRVKAMLIALIPYLLVITCTGNYSESRLFIPFVAVLTIGVFAALKNKEGDGLKKLIT